MNHDQDDLRPTDAPLDALLHERFDHESPPDLRELIAERHARGDGAEIAARLAQHESPVVRGAHRPLLTAALVLLGIGAVVGTVWSVNNAEPETPATGLTGQHALQQPEETWATAIGPGENEDGQLPQQDPKKNPLQKQQAAKKPQNPKANLEVSLRVVDQHGGPIQNFEVEIVYVHKQNPLRLGQVCLMKGVKREPRDFENDYTTIKGLPPGTFAIVVHDGIHAKSMSSPFTIAKDQPAKVEVRMNHGGELRGTVLDAEGRPVQGATVKTVAPNESEAANTPFAEVLKSRRPSLHTQATTKTNADGSFVIKKLAVGNYVLRAEHIKFSVAQLKDVGVTIEPRKPVEIRIMKGSVVHGRITKKGAPQGDYLVYVTPVIQGAQGKRYQARTDEKGQFRIAERLVPGDYKIQCREESPSNENPFGMLLQLKESERRFRIEKGKDKVEQNVDLK